ncbi:hypothetical protein R84981_002056 [Carnimonas sp. R-84981]
MTGPRAVDLILYLPILPGTDGAINEGYTAGEKPGRLGALASVLSCSAPITPEDFIMSPARLAAIVLSTVALAFCCSAQAATPSAKKNFNVCWSIYAGWMPWGYAESHGILEKWAHKYGITIHAKQVNDYIQSVNQYTSGGVDGCAMTNMDALTLPASSGVDSTALIVGDYSNGNDGIVLRNAKRLSDIKGRKVNLVQFSVSEYLLARALSLNGMTERDISTENTSDANITGLFSGNSSDALVTWNPQLSTVAEMKDANVVFTSKQIPGEILDLMVVNTDTLKQNPDFGRALVGAWYEVMGKIAKHDKDALSAMAADAGTDLSGFQHQLDNTHLYTTPKDALTLYHSKQLLKTMQSIAQFSFDHGLLGEAALSADTIGIQTPQGTFGDPDNVQLRFDPSFTEQYLESSK